MVLHIFITWINMKNVFMEIGCHKYNKNWTMLLLLINLELYFNLLSTFLNLMLIILSGHKRGWIYLTCADVVLKLTCFCFKVKSNLFKKSFVNVNANIKRNWILDNCWKTFKYLEQLGFLLHLLFNYKFCKI